MRAMVFAAGYGERLRPLTERVPKALLPVGGRPMIEYPLLLLRHYGIEEIIINLHHLGGKTKEHLQDGNRLGLKITYSEETELLDTGGGLLRARAFLAQNTFIVINSDVIIDLSLTALLKSHQRHGGIATLVLRPDPQADLYGAIEVSEDLRIQRFLAHRAPRSEAAGDLTKYMFTGVQVLEPGVFDHLEATPTELSGKFGITKITYPGMVSRGESLYGFPFHGYWQDLGTPERIAEAESKLRSGELKLHYLQA